MIPRTDLNTLPVDRGWAWAIAAAGFIAQGLLVTGTQITALLFVEILQMFNANIIIGSVIFMLGGLTLSVTSVVVTHYIMPTLTEKGCLIVGGIAIFVSTFGASFAPNIEVFIAMLTLKGIISGLCFVPAMSLIPQYFNRYQSRASTIPFCGGSAGSIIAPFIIRAVREEYGIRGVYLLLSALELHICLAGLLMRPVSAYRFLPDDDTTAGNTCPGMTPVPANSDTNSHGVLADAAAKENNGNLMQVTHVELTDDAAAAEALLDKDGVNEALHEKSNRTPDVDTDTILEHKKEDTAETPVDKTLTRWQKFYHASALETWGYRCVLLSLVPGSAILFLIPYLPTICKFQGATFDQAAFLTTITGAVDLFSRISTGFLADTKTFPASALFITAQVCLGIGCHFFRFATSFVTLIPMTIFVALFISTRGSLLSMLCLEVVGPKKFPQAYSLALVVFTFSSAFLNPALGAVVEATGSFVPVLHILGSCFFLTTGLLAGLPLLVRLDIKHGRK